MEIKKILFPTDFSEGSVHAAPYALDLANKYGARLYILHVVFDIAKAAGWQVPHVNMDELYRGMEENALGELEKCAAEQFRGLKEVEFKVVRGTPHEEIIKFSLDKNIDLIIMGTHSRKGLDRIIFGSTAERVVRNAPCPVMTAGSPAGR